MNQPMVDDIRTLETNVKDAFSLDDGCVVRTLPGAAQRVAAVLDSYSASRSINLVTVAGGDSVIALEYSPESAVPTMLSQAATPIADIVAHYDIEPLTAGRDWKIGHRSKMLATAS